MSRKMKKESGEGTEKEDTGARNYGIINNL